MKNEIKTKAEDIFSNKFQKDLKKHWYGMFIYEDIVFNTEEDAKNVLKYLKDTIEQYKNVTLGDYYDILGCFGIESIYRSATGSYTWHIGWGNLEKAEIIKVDNGYKLKLPKPDWTDINDSVLTENPNGL